MGRLVSARAGHEGEGEYAVWVEHCIPCEYPVPVPYEYHPKPSNLKLIGDRSSVPSDIKKMHLVVHMGRMQ